MEVMVRMVEETFKRLQPVFARKVKFLELMIVKGEGNIEWANRINQQSKLAHLEADLCWMVVILGTSPKAELMRELP